VIDSFVDIGGVVEHYCLIFPFIMHYQFIALSWVWLLILSVSFNNISVIPSRFIILLK